MRNVQTFLAIIFLLALSGCASRVWCNPSVPSPQERIQAQHDCKTDPASAYSGGVSVNEDPHAARGISGGGLGTSIGQDPYEFTACMEKRGYHYVEKARCDTVTTEK